jgi:hypothetical protein
MVTGSLDSQRNQNYILYTSVLDESGGSPTSANYRLEASSAGQPTPIGASQSANYNAFGGYIYTLEIACADPPEIVAMTLENGKLDCPYSEELGVQPGTGTRPFQWSVSGGALPPGLQLDSATGMIEGRSTATGTSDFTVQVTDMCGATDTQAFSITIDPYEHIKSDANTDCAVDILDVLFVIRIILEEEEPTQDQKWCADCNGPDGNCDGDGEVNIIDALKIVRIILGEDACP